MNIEFMNDNIRYFEREIIRSGFKRDLDDYIRTLPSHQENIITLREVANKVAAALDSVYESDLPEALKAILPAKDFRPFTDQPHNVAIKELIEDTKIPLAEFFTKLKESLEALNNQIVANQSKFNEIRDFIAPYLSKGRLSLLAEDQATVSVVFREQNTISNLKVFTKTLSAWNAMLPVYHQLLQSESPRDVQIVEVQNGSIDFVVNINVDVALNLIEIFELGFKVFGAYLSYKEIVRPIIDSYHGNAKLIEQEGVREGLLLDNIGIAIRKEIGIQHGKALELDANIDTTATDKKIQYVAKLITSHIVKGNDLKLLAVPEPDGNDSEEAKEEKGGGLRKQSMEVRKHLRQISNDLQQKLLETYGQEGKIQDLESDDD